MTWEEMKNKVFFKKPNGDKVFDYEKATFNSRIMIDKISKRKCSAWK